MKTTISRMVWSEVQEAVDRKAVVMLPLASVEPSGMHAVMGGEQFIVEYFCEGVAKKTGDVYLPTLPFGYAPTFTEFAGSVTLSNDTLRSVIIDCCQSMIHHGFEHIMVVNNHSGNEAALEQAAREIRKQYGIIIGSVLLPPMMRVVANDLYEDLKSKDGHGGEPGVSVRNYLCPDDMRMDLAVPTEILPYHGMKIAGTKVAFQGASFNLYVDYSMTNPAGGSGDPSSPDPARGKIILDRMVDWGADLLKAFRDIPVYAPLKNPLDPTKR